MSEVRVNWSAVPKENRIQELLRTESQLRTVTAHNRHENDGEILEGGVAAAAFDR